MKNNNYQVPRSNLENYFNFIGIFEEMHDSLNRLNLKIPSLGLNLPEVNLGVYDKKIPEKTKQFLRKFNTFDEILYQDAVNFSRK